jgi:hypothetical protein
MALYPTGVAAFDSSARRSGRHPDGRRRPDNLHLRVQCLGRWRVDGLPVSFERNGNVCWPNLHPCIPSSTTNTNITITTTADGTASAVDVNSWGYLR